MTESVPDAMAHWRAERTTFQRIHDVVVGTTDPVTAGSVADRADCATPAARGALEQLAEMGIVERCSGTPPSYCRNESYLAWKREDGLARDHDAAALRDRANELAATATDYREEFGVDAPSDLSSDPAAWFAESNGAGADGDVDGGEPLEHAGLEDHWRARADWSTAHRDQWLLERAADRAERDDERRRANGDEA